MVEERKFERSEDATQTLTNMFWRNLVAQKYFIAVILFEFGMTNVLKDVTRTQVVRKVVGNGYFFSANKTMWKPRRGRMEITRSKNVARTEVERNLDESQIKRFKIFCLPSEIRIGTELGRRMNTFKLAYDSMIPLVSLVINSPRMRRNPPRKN